MSLPESYLHSENLGGALFLSAASPGSLKFPLNSAHASPVLS